MDYKKKVLDPKIKVCANCGATGAGLRCAKCKAADYCSKACQKQHWKNGHKGMCITPEDRRPHSGTSAVREAKGAAASETTLVVKSSDGDKECAICLDCLATAETVTIPCNHTFHAECVSSMRKFTQNQVCPVCRADLPPGPERAFDEALRRFLVIERRLAREGRAWTTLSKEERGEMDAVIALWRWAASEGYAEAQFNLGVVLANARGVAKDEVEAAEWFHKAAGQGVANAQFNLGVALVHGQGVAKNGVEAAKWFRKAAEQGCAAAQHNLGVALMHGEGVAKNEVEAAKWYRKAAKQGYAIAQHCLGVALANGQGVAKNEVEAAKWYRKSAEQGDADAQFNLGVVLSGGQGVTKNEVEAAKWYCRAAEQGCADAQFNLGVALMYGEGVAKNEAEAAKWYRKAAKQGYAKAQHCLGLALATGHGVAKNEVEAAKWFRKAAEQGDLKAQGALHQLSMLQEAARNR